MNKEEPVSSKVSQANHQSILDYWTEEKMKNAVPLEIDLPKETPEHLKNGKMKEQKR